MGATSRLENPTHEWKEAGDYTVTLITSNIYDCIDSVSHSVNQSGDQLRNSTVIIHHENVAFIPSAVTPNQDGNNEVFRVLGLEQIADMRMEIFDRWGNKIHEDTGVNASWDGTNDQNNVVQSGVYGYRISYQTLRGEVVNKDGVVTVLSVD